MLQSRTNSSEILQSNLLGLNLIDFLDVSSSLASHIDKVEDIIATLKNQASNRRQIVSSEDTDIDAIGDGLQLGSGRNDSLDKISSVTSYKRLLKFWLQDGNGTVHTAVEYRKLPLPDYPQLGLKVVYCFIAYCFIATYFSTNYFIDGYIQRHLYIP